MFYIYFSLIISSVIAAASSEALEDSQAKKMIQDSITTSIKGQAVRDAFTKHRSTAITTDEAPTFSKYIHPEALLAPPAPGYSVMPLVTTNTDAEKLIERALEFGEDNFEDDVKEYAQELIAFAKTKATGETQQRLLQNLLCALTAHLKGGANITPKEATFYGTGWMIQVPKADWAWTGFANTQGLALFKILESQDKKYFKYGNPVNLEAHLNNSTNWRKVSASEFFLTLHGFYMREYQTIAAAQFPNPNIIWGVWGDLAQVAFDEQAQHLRGRFEPFVREYTKQRTLK